MSHTITPASRRSILALATFTLAAAIAPSAIRAQDYVGSSGFEIRPYAGAYIPTGDQHDLLKTAAFVGAQASYRILPQLAITGSFGWSPSKDRIAQGDQKLDLYQYDLGAELRAPAWRTAGALDFTPFVSLGAGARTYDYRDLDVSAKTNVAGFGAIGGEIGFGRTGVRLEARDYVSQFKPFDGSDSRTRNDITVAAGLTLRF